MVFSSYIFIFVFLPLTLLSYFTLAKFGQFVAQKWLLVAASLIFYGYFKPEYLLIIVTSIFVNYAFAHIVQKNGSKLLCTIGVLFNLGLLGYYKYYDFFLENVNAVFGTSIPLHNILLPLGISFFTFQQLSFLISVYQKEETVSSFVDYSAFVLFFPQLVAGPIVLYSEMIPQFQDKKNLYFNWDNFSNGLFLFVMGLFKKLVIGDTIAVIAGAGHGFAEYPLAVAWAAALAFPLQVYFDFSGYSDMAIGLGRMFNIEIPINFDSPYKSASVGEYWRRWHMTLGRAIRTYIYFPLGGSRKGKVRTYINLFLSFFASGIWHGAAWTYVLFGCMHGVFNAFEKAFQKPLEKIPHKIRVFGTFIALVLMLITFTAYDLAEAGRIYQGLVNFDNIGFWQVGQLAADGIIGFPDKFMTLAVWLMYAVLITIVMVCPNSMQIAKKVKFNGKTIAITALMFVISVIHMSRGAVFIYFNF